MNRFAVALAVLAVAVSTPLLATTASARSSATSVAVTMKEFRFVLSKSSVPHGSVTFHLVNKGKLAHDLKIAGKKTPLIQPGKKGTLTVTLKKGRWPYLCTVPGHATAGMKGVLKVT